MARKKKKKDNTGLYVGAGILAFLLLKGKGAGATGTGTGTGEKVSKYYTVSDVQHSDTAQREGISEQFAPLDTGTKKNASFYAQNILDPVSDYMGAKVPIDSWWRSEVLNGTQGGCMNCPQPMQGMVGGVSNSLHLLALATDVVQNKEYLKRYICALMATGVPYHKIIITGTATNPTAVHVSLKKSGNAEQILLKDKYGNYSTLQKQVLINLCQ